MENAKRIRERLKRNNIDKVIRTMNRYGITIEDLENYQSDTVSVGKLVAASRTNQPLKNKINQTRKPNSWNLLSDGKSS